MSDQMMCHSWIAIMWHGAQTIAPISIQIKSPDICFVEHKGNHLFRQSRRNRLNSTLIYNRHHRHHELIRSRGPPCAFSHGSGLIRKSNFSLSTQSILKVRLADFRFVDVLGYSFYLYSRNQGVTTIPKPCSCCEAECKCLQPIL